MERTLTDVIKYIRDLAKEEINMYREARAKKMDMGFMLEDMYETMMTIEDVTRNYIY